MRADISIGPLALVCICALAFSGCSSTEPRPTSDGLYWNGTDAGARLLADQLYDGDLEADIALDSMIGQQVAGGRVIGVRLWQSAAGHIIAESGVDEGGETRSFLGTHTRAKIQIRTEPISD